MKKTKTLLLATLLVWTGAVLAEPSTEVAFDKETRALLRAADAQRGEELAQAQKCGRCHEYNDMPGISDDTDVPNLAGQMASYAFKQLMDYKGGQRDERSMNKAVRKLEPADMADLAVYYASLPAPEAQGGEVDPAIHRLIYKGDPKRTLKSCAGCHGRNGEGGKYDAATLTGQRLGYFIETMEQFREGDRGNDVFSRMRLTAQKLTDEEIAALAKYYAAPDPAE